MSTLNYELDETNARVARAALSAVEQGADLMAGGAPEAAADLLARALLALAEDLLHPRLVRI